MCGIFGVINFNGQPVDKEKILSARDVLAHRGPDDSGIYYSTLNSETLNSLTSNQQTSNYITNLALAHRRLSIIDLSPAAHQPMVSENGRYVIVFNGEIYNFEELRKDVGSWQSAVGNNFKSQSDTEVILKLFAIEGPKCLNKLRGMFAFAIWDDKEKKLFAARDRFGVKPFYYLHNNNEFIFSSELKAIKHYKNGLTLSMQGMDAFLRTGSVPAPLTIYEETKALLPGYWLEWKMDDGRWKMEIKQYWSFLHLLDNQFNPVIPAASGIRRDNNTRFQTSPSGLRPAGTSWNDPSTSLRVNRKYDDEAKKIIGDSLLDAVKAHMVSDVEVGAFLSGGIDSTAIVSLMRQVGQEKIKTISVTFPGHQLDESKYSNLAAKRYETDHFEYRLQEKELLDDFEKIIESMDQPTIDGINTYFVSKAAASFGLKVVLSGLGGDELFGGYPSFINIPKYQKIKSLPLAKPLMKAAGSLLKVRLPAKAIEYFKNPDTPNAEYRLIRGLFTDAGLRALGWQQSSNHPFSHSELVEGSPSVIASGAKQSLFALQYISMLESSFYMRNQLLRDSDVFSMSHSLELRVPFVDHILYGAVLSYLDAGFDKSFPKKMLVDAVGDLPDEIVHRSKQGFTFPFADWMKHGKIKEAINDALKKNTFGFDKKELSAMISKFETGNLHWSRVWALFIAGKFGG